jgi:muramoyltetrapeptide carboxypeptidase LdcA involved in peptidoglycan recycling
MLEGLEYTVNYFKQIFTSQEPVKLAPAANWSNDTWFINQNNRTFVTNKGWDIIRRGRAAGKVIGGNLCTLNLLQGTPFMPSLCDSVLFLEDNFQSDAVEFDRNLQSLLHHQHLSGLKGLVIGRFQPESKITLEELKFIINTKDELTEVPVVTGLDFGHTTPIFTFPIGGEVEINIEPDDCRIAIIKH